MKYWIDPKMLTNAEYWRRITKAVVPDWIRYIVTRTAEEARREIIMKIEDIWIEAEIYRSYDAGQESMKKRILSSIRMGAT